MIGTATGCTCSEGSYSDGETCQNCAAECDSCSDGIHCITCVATHAAPVDSGDAVAILGIMKQHH